MSAVVDKLKPLAIPLDPPESGDWLDEHDEAGQSLVQYINSCPTCATSLRNKIYIMPLGEFDEASTKILNCVVDFVSTFFGLEVIVQKSVAIKDYVTNKDAQRAVPNWGVHQILTSFLLKKRANDLPSDAATYLCFTTSDLWPGRGWNFVFGQASINNVLVFGLCFDLVIPQLSFKNV